MLDTGGLGIEDPQYVYGFGFLLLRVFFLLSSEAAGTSALRFCPAACVPLFTLTTVDLPFPPTLRTCVSAADQSADASLMAYLFTHR